MTAQHTQSNWELDTSLEKAEVKIGRQYFYFDNKKDASLVASAPELLEALKSALGNVLCLGANEDWPQVQFYRSVIAKAKGMK